ncbi:MAG: hypothetical protein ACAI38_16845 [Myxococcota bacterium]
MRFVLLGLFAVVACSDGEGDAPIALPSDGPVGEPCAAPATGSATVSDSGPDLGLAGIVGVGWANLGHRTFDPDIVFANDIDISVTSGCGHSTPRPTFTIRVARETVALGTHTIPGGADATLLYSNQFGVDPVPATGGSVTLTGFDPTTGSLCGEAILEFPSRPNFEARTVSATFAAYSYCD